MKRENNWEEVILVLSIEGSCEVGATVSGRKVLYLSSSACVISMPNGADSPHTEILSSNRLRKIFENVYMSPLENASSLSDALDAAFNYLADTYEKRIDVMRNVSCYSILLEALLLREQGRMTILDYGCGTGLIRHVNVPPDLRIVGMDRCKGMARIAENNGIDVIEENNLYRESFDGVVSCYTLHFPQSHSKLVAVWRALRKGGRFAANFHKRLNVDMVSQSLEVDLGARVVSEFSHNQHGLIRIFEKKS